MNVTPLQPRHSRSAFTLIELVVVISIIAVLLSISVGVYFRVMVAQQASNTVTAVTRIQKALSSQYDAVKKQALEEVQQWPPTSPLLQGYCPTIFKMAGYKSDRAKVIWVKLRLRQAFPTNFTEAFDSTTCFPSLYTQKLKAAGFQAGGTSSIANENSACLLLALQRSVSGGIPVDQVSQLATQQATWDGGTISILVDTYNTPLAFCRWPTGNGTNPTSLNPNLLGPQPGFNDPEDPLGLLTIPDATWNSSSFTSTVHYLYPSTANPPIMQSEKLQPIVVSAGPDTLLGLDMSSGPFNAPTFQQDSTNNANDNLSAQPNP